MKTCNCTLPPSCCINCPNNSKLDNENTHTWPNTVTWPQPVITPNLPTGKRVIEEFDSDGKLIKRITEDIVVPQDVPYWPPTYPNVTWCSSGLIPCGTSTMSDEPPADRQIRGE